MIGYRVALTVWEMHFRNLSFHLVRTKVNGPVIKKYAEAAGEKR